MENIKGYLNEVWQEMIYKVTWPTWEELQHSAMIVIIASLLIALTVFLMDFFFGAQPENPFFKGILGWLYSMFT